MEPTDLTIEILKGIRDEIRMTRTELSERIDGMRDELSGRIDEVSGRIDEVSGRIDLLSDRVVASEIRTATATTDLAGTVREMTSVLRAQHDLRPRVERCERDIADLRQKTGF